MEASTHFDRLCRQRLSELTGVCRDRMTGMERELIIGQQKILFDRDATVGLYRETIKVAGSESCDCIYCKNFAAQKQSVFPAEFLNLLGNLGIDSTREWEAFQYDFDASNPQRLILYGGWFLFVGQLVGGAETPPPEDRFVFWVVTSFPTGTLPSNVHLCAVQFLTRIPWVLAEIPRS